MGKRAWALTLALFVGEGWARAAPPDGRQLFQLLGVEQGLLDPNVTLLYQDRTGFLWAGTPNGLFRYDGRAFVRFGTEDGLPSASITAMVERSDGRFYVGTRAGLGRFDGIGFVPLGTAAALPAGPVNGLASTPDGTLFVATPKGLFLTIEEQFGQEKVEAGHSPAITALLADGPTVWFARDGRLWKRDGGRAVDAGAAAGLAESARIDAILIDAAGALWVRSVDRLDVLPKGASRFESRSGSLPPDAGSGPLAAAAGDGVIVPTARGLLTLTSAGRSLLTRRQGLENDLVLAAFSDREGSLWVAAAGAGLARRIGSGSFSALTVADGLPAGAVRAVVRAKNGGPLWLGTNEGLVRVAPDGGVTRLREENGLGGDTVLALTAAPDGTVWAGSWPGGVTRVAADGRLTKIGAEGLEAATFFVVAIDRSRDGALWAGTRNGVYRLAPGAARFAHVEIPGGEDPDTVYTFTQEPDGALWAAGRSGLVRLDAEPRRFRKKNGLRSDFVVSLAPAPGGGVVLAYREGALDRARIEGDQLLIGPFGPDDPKRPIRAVALGRDPSGAFWAGGNGVRVHPPGAPDGAAPVRFSRADGLLSDDVLQDAFFADADGTVFFGTLRGLAIRRPAPLPGPRAAPPVVLTEIWAGSRRLRLDVPVAVTPSDSFLRIGWAGLSFADASRLGFRYRLDGGEEPFVETDSREALFAGLSPGSHRFEVAALAEPGGAVPKPAVLSFRVEPPWWGTPMARLAEAALLVIGFLGLVALRTRAVRADAAGLRARVEKQELRIQSLSREVAEAGLTDPELGVRNRRFFLETVPSDVVKACRAYSSSATPAEQRNADLLLYFVEIDKFRAIVKQEGIAKGDPILRETLTRLKTVVRSSDFLVRWRDATFLVVSRGGSRENGPVLASRFLALIGGTPIALPGGGTRSVTVSVGWAPLPWLTGAPGEVTLDETVQLAARGLAAAQEAGGDASIGVLAPGTGAESAAEARNSAEGSLRARDGKSVRLVSTARPS